MTTLVEGAVSHAPSRAQASGPTARSKRATGARGWVAIATGAERARAVVTIHRIGEALMRTETTAAGDPTLGRGAAGIVLALAYLGEVFPGHGYSEASEMLLERAVAAFNEATRSYSLHSGFAGVAWVVEHLAGAPLDAAPDDDPNADADAAIAELLAVRPWRGHFDALRGCSGLGVYALARGARPTARACVAAVVRLLEQSACDEPRGAAWFTDPALQTPEERERDPGGHFDLGLAHGQAGVIAFLAGAAKGDDAAASQARALLARAVAWMLANGRAPDGGFAHTLRRGETAAVSERAAWCYGDAGVAASLLLAAEATGHGAWRATALELARRASGVSLAQSGVADAGLCHGAAGLLHLYQRIYAATGDRVLRDAARAWLTRTLDQARPGHGVAGYAARRGDGSHPDAGFVMGAAGIALALLGAVSEREPRWDGALLLSPP